MTPEPPPGDHDMPPDDDWIGQARTAVHHPKPVEPPRPTKPAVPSKEAFMARLASLVERHEGGGQQPEPDLFDPRKEH